MVYGSTHNARKLIRNSRQLVAYAGYDVLSKESGTSVHTKSKMSKKGNKYIRAA
ncbi:MAG: transposase, partial [Bacteroidales bacterium]